MWIRERCEACEGSGAHPLQYFAEVWVDEPENADDPAAADLRAIEDAVRLCAECGGNGWIEADSVGQPQSSVSGTAPQPPAAAAAADGPHPNSEFAGAGFDTDTSVEALVAAELAHTHGFASAASRRASA